MEKSEYYGIQAISNTSLGYINPEEKGCPQKFFDFLEGRLQQKETNAMLTGSLIHAKIFEPDSLSIVVVPKISDNVKVIVEKIFKSYIDAPLGISRNLKEYAEDIIKYAGELNYGQSWKEETLVKKVLEEGGSEYFEILIDSNGKTPISPDIFNKLVAVENAIKSNPFIAADLLSEDDLEFSYVNEMEVFFDLFDENGKAYAAKSKIDRLKVNKLEKTFSIIDLKTTGESVEYYSRAFFDRRVYRQIAMYELAVKNYLGEGWEPDEHSIIVCETEGYTRVRKFVVSRAFIDLGHTEINSLLQRISWHIENNEKVHSYEDVMSNFIFYLDKQ